MNRKYCATLLIFFVWQHSITFAQQTPVKKDSTKVYRAIEEFSKKKRTTKFIYSLFFIPITPVIPVTTSKHKKEAHKQIKKAEPDYEGKIIRSITITTLDPFGYSIKDTSAALKNALYKVGNNLHIRTQQITLRNLLLIHKNKPFDSLLAKESERLIRAQQYIHEVSFITQSAGDESDSVDIFIRVLDAWSAVPKGAISGSSR